MSDLRQPFYSQTMPLRSQQGAVLIVVLLFLVLIILAGAIAIRQSTTDLRLATSDQINTLLLQSADNANQSIEQSVNGSSDTDIYKAMISSTGPFGHFMTNADNIENEYIFCFRPRGLFFDINKATITKLSGGTVLGANNGYCDTTKPDDYVSKRNASMTQVSVTLTPPSPDDEILSQYTEGQDADEVSSQAFLFDINSTSVLPAYADTKVSGKDCFKQTSRFGAAGSTDDIEGCLASTNVPHTIVYEQAEVENKSQRTKCIDLGKGGGTLLCALPAS